MKKGTFLRNLAAIIIKAERKWYQFRLNPKNAEIVNQIEQQEQKLF